MKSKTLILMILLLLSVSYSQAQRRNTPRVSKITKQMATTDDGRKVELNSDGTWKYADTSSEIDVERPTPKVMTEEVSGIEYKLQKCQIASSKIITCSLEITNKTNDDLEMTLPQYAQSLYDNLGNEIKGAESVSIGNAKERITLISGVPVKAKITFKSADSSATKITRLRIAKQIPYEVEYAEFRNVQLQK